MMIFPANFYGYPYPFPSVLDPVSGGPVAPTDGVVISVAVSPPSVVLEWTGSGTADHYDIYRSTSPLDMGDKINVSPISNPVTPYVFQFTDDGTDSISAPVVGTTYYYRAVAVDGLGNVSFPSSALSVTVQASVQVLDSTQQKIYEALVSDATLNGLLGGNAIGNIRFHHMIPDQGAEQPFIVFWKLPQREDRDMRPLRRATIMYQFEIFDQTQSSTVSRTIKERIVAIIEAIADAGGLTDCSIHVFSAMMLDGGTDLYDERVNLWSYSAKLEIVAELHDV